MLSKFDRHELICEKLNDIYIRKNKDYGDSVGKMFEKLGIISIITRLGDKYNRLENLCCKPDSERQVLDESIIDTFIDIANYAIIGLIEMEIENEKKAE